MEATDTNNNNNNNNNGGTATRTLKPVLQFMTRSCEGPHKPTFATVYNADTTKTPPSFTKDSSFPQVTGVVMTKYSKDGKIICLVTNTNVLLYESSSPYKLISTLSSTNVTEVSFSPKSTFLLTWERWTQEKQEAGAQGNLFIWNVSSGQLISSFIHKTLLEHSWPVIRWSTDESYSARLVSTEIHIFASNNYSDILFRYKQSEQSSCPIQDFSISPYSSPPLISLFTPDRKGQPAKIYLAKCPDLSSILFSKTIMKASQAEFLWNSSGTAVLIKTHTDSDKTNRSYYGQSALSFLGIENTGKVNDTKILLDKEGPIHNIKWSKDGSKFIVIYGYMPAKVVMFDNHCNRLVDFYKEGAPRNTIKWSPCNRMVCVAGFGNLQGNIDVWDVKKLKKVGSWRVGVCGWCGWSEDSRWLMTALLSPKMTVDNGLKVWKYSGELEYEEKVERLYDVKWQKGSGKKKKSEFVEIVGGNAGGAGGIEENGNSGNRLYTVGGIIGGGGIGCIL